MPFVVADNFQPTRKRRRDSDSDHDHDGIYKLYQDKQHDLYLLNAAQGSPPRRVLPLSSKPKRARIATPDDKDDEDDKSGIHGFCRDGLSTSTTTHRSRVSLYKGTPGQAACESRSPSRPTAASLAPCYICHRRPTKKSDLDSFAACEGCGERACFVCVRQCPEWKVDDGMSVISEQEMLSRSFHMDDVRHVADLGAHNESHFSWNEMDGQRPRRPCAKGWAASGHRSVVCSRCCVERGREGEVVCLGCLSGMPGP